MEVFSFFSFINRLNLEESDLYEACGSRHYYSHILKLEKKESKRALDGAKLFYLTHKLRIMLICCALRFLNLDYIRINELMNKCNNALLREYN